MRTGYEDLEKVNISVGCINEADTYQAHAATEVLSHPRIPSNKKLIIKSPIWCRGTGRPAN